MSRLISPTNVRRYLLALAAKQRVHKFKRVSAATLDRAEAQVRAFCAHLVQTAPSKGATL